MPLPVVAVAAGIARVGAAAVGRAGVARIVVGGREYSAAHNLPSMTVRLSEGGRGMQKAARRMTRKVELRAQRAINRTLQKVRTESGRELAKLLNVKVRAVQRMARTTRARRGRLSGRVTFRRRAYGVGDLKGVRFRSRGVTLPDGGQPGTLRFTAYLKKQTFPNAVRYEKGGRATYYVPSSSRAKRQKELMERGKGGKAATSRLVQGTIIKSGYRGPEKVRKSIPKKFGMEWERLARAGL